MRYILASASQRRQELLERLGISFEIQVSHFDEDQVPFEGDVQKYVETLAFQKANSIRTSSTKDAVIIGSDTVVYAKGTLLGKPTSYEDAFSMMSLLAGNHHEVYSGVALLLPGEKGVKQFSVCTSVYFSAMSHEEIHGYLQKNEWQDKAGAYGIQGAASLFIQGIHGDYYNVMGLPIQALYAELKDLQML